MRHITQSQMCGQGWRRDAIVQVFQIATHVHQYLYPGPQCQGLRQPGRHFPQSVAARWAARLRQRNQEFT